MVFMDGLFGRTHPVMMSVDGLRLLVRVFIPSATEPKSRQEGIWISMPSLYRKRRFSYLWESRSRGCKRRSLFEL